MKEPGLRKKYMRDIYSKYWISAREKKYPDLPYDRYLIEKIESLKIDGPFLEVAIGTGIPFGKHFYNKSSEFKGIDISPRLIDECRRLNPGINVIVGDAEELPFSDSYFNLSYCFHSTWYFPDVYKAISEMLRVTKNGGYILFDIVNLLNQGINYENQKAIAKGKNILYPGIHILKKVIKSIIGISESWKYIITSTPTNPADLTQLLKDYTTNIFGRTNDDHLILLKDTDEFPSYARLIYLVKK